MAYILAVFTVVHAKNNPFNKNDNIGIYALARIYTIGIDFAVIPIMEIFLVIPKYAHASALMDDEGL